MNWVCLFIVLLFIVFMIGAIATAIYLATTYPVVFLAGVAVVVVIVVILINRNYQ